jgi:hypothetical protein
VKKLVFLAMAILFLMVNAVNAAQSRSMMTFSWALERRDKMNTVTVIDTKKNPVVYSGDSMKIYFKPENNVYVYFYYYDIEGNLSMLFPDPMYEKKMGEPCYIPAGEKWFVFDQHTGTETFYLLASTERLLNLEQFTKEYLNVKSREKEGKKARVLDEIKKIRKANSKFTAISEHPVSIAGSFRGTSLENMATKVEAEKFYGKTIRIEHK